VGGRTGGRVVRDTGLGAVELGAAGLGAAGNFLSPMQQSLFLLDSEIFLRSSLGLDRFIFAILIVINLVL